ncbi:MAG: hypothetical protein V1820_00025 [archaeon]
MSSSSQSSQLTQTPAASGGQEREKEHPNGEQVLIRTKETPPHAFAKARWPFMGMTPEGMMTIDGIPVKELANRFGTPVYVLSEKTLRARMRAFKAAFPYKKLEVQYAAKCNSNLSILRICQEEGIEIDASSVGEIILAILADHKPEQITFTNLYKTAQDILFAARVGVKAITIDCEEEIERVEKVGEYLNRKIGIFFRVNPLIRLGRYSTLHHKYGIPLDIAKPLIDKVLASPHLELLGFHFHGAYVESSWVYVVAAEKLLRLAKYVRDKSGKTIKYIDLGGGFPIEHDGKSKAFDFSVEGPKIILKFKELVEKYGFAKGQEPTLIFEPGKVLVGNAGVGLAKAVSVKPLGPKKTVVLDGSTYAFVPDALFYQWYYEIICASKMNQKHGAIFDIAGNTCDSEDILGFNRKLPESTVPGDIFCIMDCGSYSNVIASNFNTLKRAPIVMITEKGELKLVRRRERYADMFAPELDVLKMAEPHELKSLTNLTRLGLGKDILGEEQPAQVKEEHQPLVPPKEIPVVSVHPHQHPDQQAQKPKQAD